MNPKRIKFVIARNIIKIVVCNYYYCDYNVKISIFISAYSYKNVKIMLIGL